MAEKAGFALGDWPPHTTGFVPYLGENYWAGYRNGWRLLLMGESHYDRKSDQYPNGYLANFKSGDKEYRSFTRDVVKECIVDQSGHPNLGRFWGSLNRMLSGETSPAGETICDAWSRVAYMNYIQCIVGEHGQSPKTREMWATGAPALKDSLRILRPDRILVLGSTNWSKIKCGENTGGEIQVDRTRCLRRSVWWFPHSDDGGTGAYATWAYHPSARQPYPDPPATMRSILDQLLAFNLS